MIESEAIKVLQRDLQIQIDNRCLSDGIEAIKVAIAALEKQVPLKPTSRFTGDEWICECPMCHGITDTPHEVIVESIRYCGWCGQRLDWSEELEEGE